MVQRSASSQLAVALALLTSCAHVADGRASDEVRVQRRAASAPRPSAEVAEVPLPGGAERCAAVLPERLEAADRKLAPLVSQSEELPWELSFAAELYARAERARPDGRRAVVEIFRFKSGERGPIERELARLVTEPIAWEERVPDPRLVCEGELTCSPLRGRFLDPHTVRLARGEWGEEGDADACGALLEHHPDAFEVSSRMGVAGAEFLRSEVVLRRERDSFVRETTRRYADPGSAARALQNALQGHDELPVFAGVTAGSFGERRGSRIEQRSEVTREELAFVRDARARLQRAEQLDRAPLPGEIDARDAEGVKAAFDALRERLRPAPAGVPSHDALAMERLLSEARVHAPEDEGLLRRHFELAQGALGASHVALALAEQALAERRGDIRAWELRLRAALARRDEVRLANELARAHNLPKSSAVRMARELAARALSGGDHERAEWAFLVARKLALEAGKRPPVQLTQRVPLGELGRLLGYLARASSGGDVGLQLLVMGKLDERSERSSEAPWIAPTSGAGRPGIVFGATTWDDAQLTALGRALLAATQEGPLELVVAIEELEGTRRSTLLLSGQRSGSELAVESASRSLARLAWPRVERLLLAPLTKLTGNTYPPDALVVRASDGEEQARIARAAEQARVRCSSEVDVLSCRGALADASAATRALRQVIRALLGSESRGLWSPHD